MQLDGIEVTGVAPFFYFGEREREGGGQLNNWRPLDKFSGACQLIDISSILW